MSGLFLTEVGGRASIPSPWRGRSPFLSFRSHQSLPGGMPACGTLVLSSHKALLPSLHQVDCPETRRGTEADSVFCCPRTTPMCASAPYLWMVPTRGVTIRYPRDTIRIAIRGSRYDTYRDTCSNLHTIRIAIHGS